MELVKVGHTLVPLDNIDFIYEGDGVLEFPHPFIMLKSGMRLDIEDPDDLDRLIVDLKAAVEKKQ